MRSFKTNTQVKRISQSSFVASSNKSAFLQNFGEKSFIAHVKRNFSGSSRWMAYWTPNQNRTNNVAQKVDQTIIESRQAMEGFLTDHVRAHLRNVYGTLSGSILLAGVGATVATSSGMFVSPIVGFVGSLSLILGISFTPVQYNWARVAMLAGFSYLSGGMVAPLLAKMAILSPGTIASALVGTSAIFAGFTGAALFAKKDTFLKMGGPLMGGLLGLIGIQLAGIFFPSFGHLTFNFVTLATMGIFSLFISYDTQSMIARAQAGETDVVGDCLNLFLDVYNIFVSLLRWGGLSSDE